MKINIQKELVQKITMHSMKKSKVYSTNVLIEDKQIMEFYFYLSENYLVGKN